MLVTVWKGEHCIPNFLLARKLYNPHRRLIDSVLSYDSQEMLRKLKRVVIINNYYTTWVKKVALILENSWIKFWWAQLFLTQFLPANFVCFFFRKEQGSSVYLIEVGGSSYMGMFGYLTAFQEMLDQVKLQTFSVLCAHFVHFWSRSHEFS